MDARGASNVTRGAAYSTRCRTEAPSSEGVARSSLHVRTAVRGPSLHPGDTATVSLMARSFPTRVAASFLSLAFAACGGTTVVDPGSGGSGGTGGAPSTSSSGGSTSSSTSSGTVGCNEDVACPPNSVCIWSTGVCAEVCGDMCSSCPTGEVCNDCATGSCPGCEDCVAACTPAQPGQCDDHTDCATEEVCVFSSGQCEPSCTSQVCADPNLVCADCVTSSGPCLADCVGACIAPP